ncbi:MAG: hypothetical protein KIT84_32545 [Labilithrix sp.]|nr:hypothetical protein [Labilithrix sp.]MCW5815804.1 hypothetical protein [Labilithrix sp.]
MDRAALAAKFDRLLALRGDPVKGLPATEWQSALEEVPRETMMRALIDMVRSLILEEWADRRKDDKRPQVALEATEAWLAGPTADNLKAVKAAAKECTAARNDTFGDGHRVPQAARHVAWTAGNDDASGLFEAIQSVEEELLARIALMSEYHRGPEMRRAIADVLKKHVLPPEEKAAPAPASLPKGPVPYNADSHFELGQRITHKKFGEIVVTSVGETWIEVELPDQSKKRLAHKP